MINTNIYWAAGFFDGEGCAYLTKPNSNQRYRYVSLSVNQVTREPLERFQEAMEGRGVIRGPYKHGEWQPIYKYEVRKIQDVWWVYQTLAPHLCSPKRIQIEEAINLSNETRKHLGNTNLFLNPGECRRGHSPEHRTERGQCRMCMRVTDAKRRNGLTPEWIARWEEEGGVTYTGW